METKVLILFRYNYCSLPNEPHRTETTPSDSDFCSRPKVSAAGVHYNPWKPKYPRESVPDSRDNAHQVTLWKNKTRPGRQCSTRTVLNKKHTSKGSNAYTRRKLWKWQKQSTFCPYENRGSIPYSRLVRRVESQQFKTANTWAFYISLLCKLFASVSNSNTLPSESTE